MLEVLREETMIGGERLKVINAGRTYAEDGERPGGVRPALDNVEAHILLIELGLQLIANEAVGGKTEAIFESYVDAIGDLNVAADDLKEPSMRADLGGDRREVFLRAVEDLVDLRLRQPLIRIWNMRLRLH